MSLSKNLLIGVWSLEEYQIHRKSGEIFIWPGKQNGTLIYTNNGFVSVAQNRQPLDNPDDNDRKRVANFYTGTYQLDLENSRIFHIPLQATEASIIGKSMERQLQLLPDGRLSLSGTGFEEIVTLIWSKISG